MYRLCEKTDVFSSKQTTSATDCYLNGQKHKLKWICRVGEAVIGGLVVLLHLAGLHEARGTVWPVGCATSAVTKVLNTDIHSCIACTIWNRNSHTNTHQHLKKTPHPTCSIAHQAEVHCHFRAVNREVKKTLRMWLFSGVNSVRTFDGCNSLLFSFFLAQLKWTNCVEN